MLHSQIEQAPIWSAKRLADVEQIAREWLSSPQMHALASEIGDGDRRATPAALARWSAETLDTRHGRERGEVPPIHLPSTRVDTLLDLAGQWGMINTQAPQRDSYEATILLGGTTTGNRLRTELAGHCAERGIELGLLVAASSERQISDHECYCDPNAKGKYSEWENLLRNVVKTFGPLNSESEDTGRTGTSTWRDASFSSVTAPKIRVLVAPPREERARANTADVLSFLQGRLSSTDYPHILLVTGAIYAPYQFFVAAPFLLAAGIQYVELIGTATAIGKDQNFLAQRLAQETHAAISVAVSLLDDPFLRRS